MQVKQLPEGLRQSLAEIDAQRDEIQAEIKRLTEAKDAELQALRDKLRQSSDFKDELLTDLFEKQEGLGWFIELSEDGLYAVQRYAAANMDAAYAEQARQSQAAYGPLGFPPGVPR